MNKFRINLSGTERAELVSMLKKGKSKAQHFQYAQILLGCDESNSNIVLSSSTLSERLHISTKTVERVRKRFCEQGMGIFVATTRATRSDKKCDARVEAHLLALACQSPPEGASRWKLQLLSDRLVELQVVDSISTASVCNLLKKTKLNLFTKNNI